VFNVGPAEIIVILLIALIVFGPKRLPEIGKTVGKGLREFRQATQDVKNELSLNLDDDDDEPDPSSRTPQSSSAPPTLDGSPPSPNGDPGTAGSPQVPDEAVPGT
jgi:sec-independent protein translocase protein TatA